MFSSMVFKVKFTTSNIGLNCCARPPVQTVQHSQSATVSAMSEERLPSVPRRVPPEFSASSAIVQPQATSSADANECAETRPQAGERRHRQLARYRRPSASSGEGISALWPRSTPAHRVSSSVGTPYAMPRHIEQVWQPVCHQQPKPKVGTCPATWNLRDGEYGFGDEKLGAVD